VSWSWSEVSPQKTPGEVGAATGCPLCRRGSTLAFEFRYLDLLFNDGLL
jgi:hypothetical protein